MKTTSHRTPVRLRKNRLLPVGLVSAALIVSLLGLNARAADQEKDSVKLAEKKVETKKETKVQITGSLIPQKVKRAGFITDTSYPVAIIDRAEIERTGGATLTQVLRRHPAGR